MADASERLTLGIHLMLTEKRWLKDIYKVICRKLSLQEVPHFCFSAIQYLAATQLIKKILSSSGQPQRNPTNGSLLILKDFFWEREYFTLL